MPLRPSLDEVLYEPPLPGGVRRTCAGCVFWDRAAERCAQFSPRFRVVAKGICGLFSAGKPTGAALRSILTRPLEPASQGYAVTTGGTSCSNCTWFRFAEGKRGTCLGVRGDGLLGAEVHGGGCCTRWLGIDGTLATKTLNRAKR